MKELITAAFADVSIVARYRGPTTPDIIEEPCYDISKGGMFVRSIKPLPSGTLIKFECQVDDDPNDIQGIGRVVWQRDEDGPEAPSGMGVKFLVLRPGSPEIIERIIRRAGRKQNLSESALETEQQSEPERAHQRTSYRARTLIGNQADKLVTEIDLNRSAKREQPILTAKNAQKPVADAKKTETTKRTQSDALSQVRSAPIITVTQEDKPKEESKAVDATERQQDPKNQTVPVQPLAQDKGRRDNDDDIGSKAEAVEDKTARALQLAAQRARELAEKEATLRNLELAAERAIRAGKQKGVFSANSLVFVSIIVVILLRIGYVMYDGSENERRALRQRSVETTSQSVVATHGEIIQRSSQETATQTRGSEQPAVEPVEETKRPVPGQTESSERGSLKKGMQARSVESNKAIKPQEPQRAQSSETEKRFEKAAACEKRGDHLCVIQLLSNRVSSEEERSLLSRAYRSAKRKQRALQKEEKYQRVLSPAESWANPPRQSMSRTSKGGIPDNPYPE